MKSSWSVVCVVPRPLRACLWSVVIFLISCQQPPITPTQQIEVLPTATVTPQIGLEFATVAPPTQAIVQITPSPLPTPTPTPTPTPVVYNVQEGDTIWSIAYTNGTVPDDLLALNPNVRPELLSVGQALVLPPPATPIFQEADGTPIPLGVRVRSVSIYGSPSGGIWIVGEVENEGTLSAENIIISLDISAFDGTPLGTVTTNVAAPLVPAGERAPFGVFVRGASAESVRVSSTSVIAGTVALTLGNRTFDLDSADVTFENDQLNGTITLSNSMTTTTSIIATFYDGNGNVTSFAQTTLDISSAAPFSFSPVPVGGRMVNYRLLLYGVVR